MPVYRTTSPQNSYQVRFGWGGHELRALAASSVVIVVDVLSFGTAVDIATARGARVLPLPWRDERARRAAANAGAVLAADRSTTEWSLSPSSLATLDDEVLLALPSPNGATLCGTAAEASITVFAGSLRNAHAVAKAAARAARDGTARGDGGIAVIAAGERTDDATIRFAVEDQLGAGAVLDALGTGSPEAEVTAASFRACRDRLEEMLADCVSGQELIGYGFAHDVRLAAELDVSADAPRLLDGVLGTW